MIISHFVDGQKPRIYDDAKLTRWVCDITLITFSGFQATQITKGNVAQKTVRGYKSFGGKEGGKHFNSPFNTWWCWSNKTLLSFVGVLSSKYCELLPWFTDDDDGPGIKLLFAKQLLAHLSEKLLLSRLDFRSGTAGLYLGAIGGLLVTTEEYGPGCGVADVCCRVKEWCRGELFKFWTYLKMFYNVIKFHLISDSIHSLALTTPAAAWVKEFLGMKSQNLCFLLI